MSTQELVLTHMNFAEKLARKRKRSLPSYIDIYELFSAAYLGLTEAANSYDESRNVAFKTYSYRRILGAIDDYLQSLGYSISLDIRNNITGLSKSDLIESKQQINHDHSFDLIESLIGNLGSNIFKLYFLDNYDLKEIGLMVGVSESRICQLLNKYKLKIRECYDVDEFSIMIAA